LIQSIYEKNKLRDELMDLLVAFFIRSKKKLENVRKIWVERISVVVLRGFDARCRKYMKNRTH
jgi:hypothetical protein